MLGNGLCGVKRGAMLAEVTAVTLFSLQGCDCSKTQSAGAGGCFCIQSFTSVSIVAIRSGEMLRRSPCRNASEGRFAMGDGLRAATSAQK